MSSKQSTSSSSIVEELLQDHPFPIPGDLSSFTGEYYTTHQILVQQVAHALSGSIFSYSPESFGLDTAISKWKHFSQANAQGVVPNLNQLESRAGAASILLGYIYNNLSKDASLPVPQTVLASTATLKLMEPVLAQYAVKPSSTHPLAFNVASIDLDIASGSLVTDYTSALKISRDLGLGLISSSTISEAQHMTLLSTILSTSAPTIHIYDGIRGLRESSKASNVLDVAQIGDIYKKIASKPVSGSNAGAHLLSTLKDVNEALGTSYKPFEYTGHASAKTVIIAFGSSEAVTASQVAEHLSQSGHAVGAINVRVYSPFIESEFFATLPKSAENIIVLGQVDDEAKVEEASYQSPLYLDVATAHTMKYGFASKASPVIVDAKYARSKVWTREEIYNLYDIATPAVPARADVKEVTFWDLDNSKTADTPSKLAHVVSLDGENSVSHISYYDNEVLGGVIESQLRVSRAAINAPYPVEHADFVFVNNLDITKNYDVLFNAKQGAKVLIAGAPNVDGLEKALGSKFKRSAAAKEVSLFAYDIEAIGENSETLGKTKSMVEQISFWKTFSPELTLNQITTKIVTANGVDTELVAATVAILIEKVTETALSKIEIPNEWSQTEATEAEIDGTLVNNIKTISFAPTEKTTIQEETGAEASDSWVEAAKSLTFKEAYGATQELRPDLPVKNFVAKVQENRRVTPDGYERHIFHFQLDITGTGLTYAIGEALGVHARNNKKDVTEFLEWYGINPEAIVSVPAREDPLYNEVRTAYQAFRDNLDIFGKPPKKFYESLAPFATDDKEKAHLEKLASAAGAEELKHRAEVDFDSFADILKEFKSAHPSLSDLVQIVAPLKRREYSIASSQKVHPNAVHLLIVVVDWVDSKGRTRYGQCSKYLSDLPVGAELVVSVKPSVMKLPPLSTQPIIMAGLGTGLAPFKAFVEEKMWQQAQGQEIGEIYLYLGSRHQKEEYLYGELWEAYKDAGIVTHIGAAFSRDQPQKIYIQDRIRESLPELVSAFVDKNGSFYLCGPTWPVPDITACLEDILTVDSERRGVTIDTAREIEELKETGRYVLEVY